MPRIRRELRTLSEAEREAFFDAIKLMRNTSDASGVQKYGKAFRGYDYMSFKHAIATVHKCADQAHLPENVIVYHRAFLLEFERAVLAIVKVIAPQVSLQALPYWNWFIDVEDDFVRGGEKISLLWEEAIKQETLRIGVGQQLELQWADSVKIDLWKFKTRAAYLSCNFAQAKRVRVVNRLAQLTMDKNKHYYGAGPVGSCLRGNRLAVWPDIRSGETAFLHSSLWKYWGSPYGDPTGGMYSIHDPYFNTSVPNIKSVVKLNPNTSSYVFEILGDGRWLSNSYGFYRSPWSESKSPRLTRNPGWIYNSNQLFDLPGQAEECLFEENHSSFAFCTAGAGVRSKELNFGAHFAPHVFLGTFNDAAYIGQGAIVEVKMMVYSGVFLLLLALLHMTSSKIGEKRKRFCRSIEIAMLGIFFVSTAYTCLSILPAAKKSTIGLDGAFKYDSILYDDFGIYKFGQREWRYGIYNCPTTFECSETGSCNCLYRTRSWSGSRLLRVLPEPYPFTGSDYWSTSFSINENFFASIHALYDMMHFAWAENQVEYPSSQNRFGGFPVNGSCYGMGLDDIISEEMCFTEGDTGLPAGSKASRYSSRHVMSPRQPCLSHAQVLAATMQRDKAPYVYDRLYESYSWHAKEPAQRCPHVETVCSRKANRIELKGEVLCVDNTASASLKNYKVEANQTKCVVATGRPKPSPPIRVCNCKFETHKALELERREKNALSDEVRWFWTGIVFLAAAPLFTSILFWDLHGQSTNYTPLQTN